MMACLASYIHTCVCAHIYNHPTGIERIIFTSEKHNFGLTLAIGCCPMCDTRSLGTLDTVCHHEDHSLIPNTFSQQVFEQGLHPQQLNIQFDPALLQHKELQRLIGSSSPIVCECK